MKIVGCSFIGCSFTGFDDPPHMHDILEDCAVFDTREAYEAWLKTPEGIAWQERNANPAA